VDEARESGREMLKQFLVSQSTVGGIRVNGQRNLLLILIFDNGIITDILKYKKRGH